MNFKNIFLGIFGIAIFAGLTSCKKEFDRLSTNPNYPDPSKADADLYLNQVQLSFNNFFASTPSNLVNAHYSASDFGAQLTRQLNWTGPFYRNGYTPPSFDDEWIYAYASDPVYAINSGVINNGLALVPLAQQSKKYVHSGIARVLMAYTLGTLVDDFGDVPFSQAALGTASTSPKVDPGATAYASVQTLLDSAIADFAKPSASGPANDLFYPGGSSKDNYHSAYWTTLAKTLKLKYYMQARLVDNTVASKVQALLTEDDLINDPSQDFVFNYGINLTSPDSRHPHYGLDYVSSGGVGEYLSNYFMWMVASQKYGGVVNLTGDPRLRYYFYRQVKNYSWANSQTCPCFVNSQFGGSNFPAWYPSVPDQTPYCVIGRGYYGRDHGDNSGAPPDGSFRTAWGVYPAGGQFDADQFTTVNLGIGGAGAGINPIWLSSFTSFLEAEAALTLGVTIPQTDPRTALTNGVTTSINKVMAFPSTIGVTPSSSVVPSGSQVASYISLVQSNYDTATTNDSRLNIIMTEYYLALWGNGVEAYNNFRRTGKPNNMQPAVAVPDPGHFMRSFFYPSVFVNRNSNAPAQKNPGNAVDKVFWDNNPDDFIK